MIPPLWEHAPPHRVVAVVLAGGRGLRYESDLPKQLAMVGDAAVLEHVFRAIDRHPLVDRVIVPVHQHWAGEIIALARGAFRCTPWITVAGGDTRNDSVFAAITALDLDEAVIVINDGARPLVSHDLISDCVGAIGAADAVLPVTPIIDLVVELDAEGRFHGFVPRSRLACGQTPQVFWLSMLTRGLSALTPHERAACATVYEALLINKPDLDICLVPGDPRNIKLTLPSDRHLVLERLLADRDFG